MTFAAFSSALKNAYDIVSEDAAYADEHKVRDLLDKIMPTSKVQQMEVIKGKVRDDYPTDFDNAISYIASRIAEIYSDDIAKLNRYGIGKRNRQVYEAKSDNGGRGRGRGNGQRMAIRGGRGGGRHGGRAGRGGNNHGNQDRQRILFNGIDATEPDRPFSGPEWDQLGPNGRAYVMHEKERLTGRMNARGGRQVGRFNGRGNHRGGAGGRIVSEITVQEQLGDTSTVTSKGGRSGAGFGIGAYQGGVAQE
jgi:hypothetical protein